jgi:hypothetical protein
MSGTIKATSCVNRLQDAGIQISISVPGLCWLLRISVLEKMTNSRKTEIYEASQNKWPVLATWTIRSRITIHNKNTSRRSEDELADSTYLSRWESCSSFDARRFCNDYRKSSCLLRGDLLLCSSTIALGGTILYHMDVLWFLSPSPPLQTGL